MEMWILTSMHRVNMETVIKYSILNMSMNILHCNIMLYITVLIGNVAHSVFYHTDNQ